MTGVQTCALPILPGGNVIGVSAKRLFLSKGGNIILKNSFSKKIYTSTCVVRAYRRHVIDSVLLESDDKEIHLEILAKILSLGYKIKEIPGTLTSRKAGKSKNTIIPTVLSHLKFFAFEKPFIIFGFLGMFIMLVGFVFGLLLIYTRFISALELGGLERLFSPNVVMVFLFVGMLLIAFGFLGIQINLLRNEMYKMQGKMLEYFRKRG